MPCSMPTLEHSRSIYPANYDLPLYLIFAVWNLPLALVFHFEGNGFITLWCKILIVLCTTGCCGIVYRFYKLTDEKGIFTRGFFLLFMMTSPLVFLGEFVAGQYDCIGMILILAGLYEYLKGKDRYFLLFFCLALPIKTFAVFLFIPLLVYKEKNLLKILLKTMCIFAIPLLCKMYFGGDPAYEFLLQAQSRDAAELLMTAGIQVGDITVHVFLILFILVCFFCYFRMYDESRVLLLSAVIYTSFIIFVPIRSYWVFLAEPFMILLIASNSKRLRENLLVHTVGAASGCIYFLYSYAIYNSYTIARGFMLGKLLELPPVVKYGSFHNFIAVHGWSMYMLLLRTIYVGSFILLLAIDAVPAEKMHLCLAISARALAWLRAICIAGVTGIMVFVEVYPAVLPAIDTLCYDDSSVRPYIEYAKLWESGEEIIEGGESNMAKVLVPNEGETPALHFLAQDITSGAVIEQPFAVSDEKTVSEICFQCYNTSSARSNRVRVKVSIIDADTGAVLAETIVGAALIKTKDVYIANIEELQLHKGNYLVRFSKLGVDAGILNADDPIYLMCNPENHSAVSARVDGVTGSVPVCVCVN